MRPVAREWTYKSLGDIYVVVELRYRETFGA